MLFDTHAHLEDARFDADRQEVIARMKTGGMTHCVCVGSDVESSHAALSLAETESFLYAAVGVHPHEAKTYDDAAERALLAMLSHEKVKAWGEIGLDYYYDLSPREVQREVFLRQLALAHAHGMPAILHVRDAHGEVIDLLRARRGSLPVCVVHCYSGSWESAKVYLDMGFYLSVAGPVTFRKSTRLQEVAKLAPMDRLLVETDCPYLSPEPLRGKRNEPMHVQHTARFIAALRGMAPEAFCIQTAENGKRFFGIA